MIHRLDLHNFSPCFLVASPQLQDPNFQQAVVFLLEFKEDGAFGLIINRPLDMTLGSVEAPDVKIATDFRETQLWFGGPVSPDEVLCLYERPGDATGNLEGQLSAEIAVAPANRLLADSDMSADFPGAFRVFAGSSGWGSEQLDHEIQTGSWVVAPLQPDLILAPTSADAWNITWKRMGINPHAYVDAPTTTMN